MTQTTKPNKQFLQSATKNEKEKNWAISISNFLLISQLKVVDISIQFNSYYDYIETIFIFWQQAKLFELDMADVRKEETLDFFEPPFCLEMEPVWASVSSE